MAGDKNIFQLSQHFDWKQVTGVMAAVIVLSIILELSVHYLNHRFHHEPYMKSSLEKLYQQIMILGIISFATLLVLQFSHAGSSEIFLFFEFCHLWVFFTAVIFVCHAALLITVTKKSQAEWNLIENKEIGVLVEKANVNDTRPLNKSSVLLFGRTSFIHSLEYHLFRILFLEHNKLPPTFQFASYLRGCLSETIDSQVELHPTSWLALLVLCLINLGIQELGNGSPSYILKSFIYVGWVIAATSLAVLIASRRIKNDILQRADVHTFGEMGPKLMEKYLEKKVSDGEVWEHTRTKRTRRVTLQGLKAAAEKEDRARRLSSRKFWLTTGFLFKMLNMILIFSCFQVALIFMLLIDCAFKVHSVGIALTILFLALFLPIAFSSIVIIPKIVRNLVFVDAIANCNDIAVARVSALETWLTTTKLMLSVDIRVIILGEDHKRPSESDSPLVQEEYDSWFETSLMALFEHLSPDMEGCSYGTFRAKLAKWNLAEAASFTNIQWSELLESIGNHEGRNMISFSQFRQLVRLSDGMSEAQLVKTQEVFSRDMEASKVGFANWTPQPKTLSRNSLENIEGQEKKQSYISYNNLSLKTLPPVDKRSLESVVEMHEEAVE